MYRRKSNSCRATTRVSARGRHAALLLLAEDALCGISGLVDEALSLAHRAKLGEILVSPMAVEQASAFNFELVEDGIGPQHALPWSAKVDEQFYVAPTMTHTAGATFSQEDPT